MKIIKYLRMRKYKNQLIKERIKKYPEKALSKILNLEHDFEDKSDEITEIKKTSEEVRKIILHKFNN